MKTSVYRPAYSVLKVRDGLFMSDEMATHDRSFLQMYNVTTIINCSQSQLRVSPILCSEFSINVVSFDWKDNDLQVILDGKNHNIDKIISLVDKADEQGHTTLICSKNKDSRCLTVIVAYMIRKYCWSLIKSLQYLNSCNKNLQIRKHFLNQLSNYQLKLKQNSKAKYGRNLSTDWDSDQYNSDAQLIRNTFLNGKKLQSPVIQQPISKPKPTKSVVFKLNQPQPQIKNFRQYDDSLVNTWVSNNSSEELPSKPTFNKQVTPYRIRRLSQRIKPIKTQPLKTQPQQMEVNINFNIKFTVRKPRRSASSVDTHEEFYNFTNYKQLKKRLPGKQYKRGRTLSMLIKPQPL